MAYLAEVTDARTGIKVSVPFWKKWGRREKALFSTGPFSKNDGLAYLHLLGRGFQEADALKLARHGGRYQVVVLDKGKTVYSHAGQE